MHSIYKCDTHLKFYMCISCLLLAWCLKAGAYETSVGRNASYQILPVNSPSPMRSGEYWGWVEWRLEGVLVSIIRRPRWDVTPHRGDDTWRGLRGGIWGDLEKVCGAGGEMQTLSDKCEKLYEKWKITWQNLIVISSLPSIIVILCLWWFRILTLYCP